MAVISFSTEDLSAVLALLRARLKTTRTSPITLTIPREVAASEETRETIMAMLLADPDWDVLVLTAVNEVKEET